VRTRESATAPGLTAYSSRAAASQQMLRAGSSKQQIEQISIDRPDWRSIQQQIEQITQIS